MSATGFLFTQAPHTTASGREGLDAVLATSAYSEELCCLFVGEGVLQLLSAQEPEVLKLKDYVSAFKLLDLYDIEEVFVSHSALGSYGLTADDLIIDCEVLDDGAMADTLAKCDKVLRF
ncbi:sulfurtransferase complex subunit TusC [Vibrio ulleungensis]|uniref:Protein TusC homolog n=1 Tax=Vibrio ulleungensis TaxID=2807619 RepID=A0ABS2HKS0_9VIBR|nr:sulfurtransferase complex subunit TusC [Vibrio ulleungensis]MBM7037281.1 sulfurtransferase complex subunit TusC [Vibrio ulleungensis]